MVSIPGRRVVHILARVLIVGLVVLSGITGGAVFALNSAWGHDRLRQLITSQAGRVLDARLEIDRLEGTLVGGVRLHGVRLVQDDVVAVSIDDVAVAYSLRQLWDGGTSIRRLDLRGLRVVAARRPDGRWNLGALGKPRPPRGERTGGRIVRLDRVELVDATVELRDPLSFGAVHVPTRFDDLQAIFAFELQGSAWRADFSKAQWAGHAPELIVNRLAGALGTGPQGWTFDRFHVETSASTFTLDGTIARGPTVLSLDVAADRFAFQEWGGLLPGLKNIAVRSAFTAKLKGPPHHLGVDLSLQSDGGAIVGPVELDATVPGWHGSGRVELTRLDLARWLNDRNRASDITGRVDFDLDLGLGQHFPRGRYGFSGSHAAYAGYAADDLTAKGAIGAERVNIESATATAYGANLLLTGGSIALDRPFAFRFIGRADGLDLRRVPRTIPVPHVDSTLAFVFDTQGQFAQAWIAGRAEFDESEFLGAQVGAGTVGHVDTSNDPFQYSGAGDISDVDIGHFGEALEIDWMHDPRYNGTVSGHFSVVGTGGAPEQIMMSAQGRLDRATAFDGTLSDADVSLEIADGSLRALYDGRFDGVNPARAFDDPRFDASLSGSGRATIAADGLLAGTTTLDDYSLKGAMTFDRSSIRGMAFTQGSIEGTLASSRLNIDRLEMSGQALEGRVSGVLPLDGTATSRIDYDVVRLDLTRFNELLGASATGTLVSQGRMAGSLSSPHLTGNARVSGVDLTQLTIDAGAVDYDTTIAVDDPWQSVAQLSGAIGPMAVSDQALNEVSGAVHYDRGHVTLDLRGTRSDGIDASLTADASVAVVAREASVTRMTLTVQGIPWRLEGGPAHITWNEEQVSVSDLVVVDVATGKQQIAASATRRPTGFSAHIVGSDLFLDTFAGVMTPPARYGGRLNVDATIERRDPAGTPIATGTFTVTEGRVRRFAFDELSGRVDYHDGSFVIDARLDQASGVWLTAVGSVPLALFVEGEPDLPLDVAVASSPIDLGVIEGITDVVSSLSGRMVLNMKVIGTAQDPHFDGSINVTDAGFTVSATGARYQRGRVSLSLARDQIVVDSLHLEDRDGHPLELKGSLGTHERRVGDLAIEATARHFEVFRNAFGSTDVDANLRLQGQFESPRLIGSIVIAGGELRVDEILDRTLLQPYATEATPGPGAGSGPLGELDALAALNPWQRLGLDLSVRSRGTLRMVGQNVQVSAGTPLGLGNVNVRAFGEVYLYKDPAEPLFVTGSLDSLIGTYEFQGRRFDLDPDSSIVFQGDLNPELYVTVRRTVTAVETRVSIIGPLREPELRLSSTPPLDDSNILSLIVFNTSINELSVTQQQELAVRAGTLAAGFLTTPLLNAFKRSIGVDILDVELESQSGQTAPRVTVGDEIAPGLVARFSRQFGEQEYSEASIEYVLSRLFRIRATFSDAGTVLARSPFRRVERAGIDFLLFFSF